MRTPDAIAAVAKSVAAKVKDFARNRREDPMQVQTRFVLERFLHRLSASAHSETTVLKGGMLLLTLTGAQNRPTQDVDLHFLQGMAEEQVKDFVRAVAAVDPSQEDGIVFDVSDLKVEVIREGLMPGFRVSFYGDIQTQPRPSRVRMKLDLAWGEQIRARRIEMPVALRGFEPVQLLAYPWETVLAEKLHAVQRHGRLNTRLKDFYDMALLSRELEIDGVELSRAIQETFAAWGATLPDPGMVGLTAKWASENERGWAAFKKGKALKTDLPTFVGTVAEIRVLVIPALEAAAEGRELEARWTPGAGWESGPAPGLSRGPF